MTERLYYTDSYQRTFRARVVARDDAAHTVVLDRSAFYPTSGGQPHDVGTLGGVAVQDVRDEGDRVVHVLAQPLAVALDVGAEVAGEVDWPRRWDHMQQHTGQHLLSGVFESHFGWPTVSVAFGAEVGTVELATPAVGASALAEAERMANAIVCDDRPVTVTFEDAAEANRRLRKPSDRAGTLRIVTIHDLDVSACGGTHVRRTGELGAILLGRTERVRDHVRVEFRCGARAIAHARRERELLAQAAAALGAAPAELPTLVTQQHEQLRAAEKARTRLLERVAELEAVAAVAAAMPDARGHRRLVVERDDVESLKAFAQAAARLAGTVVAGRAGSTVVLACAADVGRQAGAELKALLAAHGGRGGGSPTFAQGTVPDAAAAAALLAQIAP